MKTLKLFFLIGIFSFLSSYSFSQTSCFDSSLVDQNIICPQVIDPVCGCDGVTYNNACEATYYYGITSYTPGQCGGNPCNFTFSTSVTEPNCSYSCDGSISVWASGTTVNPYNYTYVWSNGFNDNTLENLCCGSYTVSATDSLGCTNSTTITVTCPPVLQITATSTPQTYQSSSSSYGSITVNANGGAPGYLYSIDNGNSYQGSNTFYGLSAGIYIVQVMDDNGCIAIYTIEVDYDPCQASITYTSGQSPCDIIFSATGADNYSWDFGDGNSGYGQNVTHTYSGDGTYIVSLGAYSANGGWNGSLCDSIIQTITVTGCGGSTNCQASFNFADSNCIVEFYGSGASSYTWSFGDGTSGQGQYDYHTYSNNGTYNVCMYAYDQNGMICDTVCQNVYVSGCNNTGGGCQTFFTYTMGQSPCEYYFTATGASTYTWDFGDGNTGSGQNVSNTFSSDGSYYITLLGYNANGVLCDSIAQYLTIIGCGSSSSCQAGFNYADSNCIVEFYGSGASSYTWSFGDGTSGQGQYEYHTYSNNGTYNVCMYAYDQNGMICDTVCQNVYVSGCNNTGGGCQTYFTYTMGQSPCEYIFTATGADSYSWDFGDGNTGTGQNISHTFSSDGIYFITLLGYNPNGVLCDSTGQYLTINGCGSNGCVADFYPFIDSSCTVYFTNVSLNAYSFEWDFGDGNTSTDIDPVHTYSDMGPHIVSLYAYDIQGLLCDSMYLTITLMDCGAGIDEHDADFGLEIFPNPTTNGGNVNLNLPNSMKVEVKILSAVGELVDFIYSGHLDSGRQNIKWSNNEIASGLYIVQISTPYGVQKKKLLVQR